LPLPPVFRSFCAFAVGSVLADSMPVTRVNNQTKIHVDPANLLCALSIFTFLRLVPVRSRGTCGGSENPKLLPSFFRSRALTS
jgi:hypothetical protein